MKELRVSYIIDKAQLVLNVGARDNIQPDQRFLIYGLSDKDIIDPATGNSLGRLELVRGTGTVSYIQDTMCIIESDDMFDFKNPTVGDHARLIF